MNKEFKAAYQQLNEAQRQAVDTVEGPVLVVAGPGTGKTQLLSLRVANILDKTDTDSASVLCLTFTNFAATNMRERLFKLVGPDSHDVVVRTFHSFAAEIMNLYPDYFWNGARLNIAPDAAQLEVIQDILARLPLDNPLASKFAGKYTALGDVQQALKLSKEAGLTPDKLRAMVNVNQAYIDVIEPKIAEALSGSLSYKSLDKLSDLIDDLPDQPIDQAVTPLTSLSTVIKDSLGQAIKADEGTGKTTNTGKWKRRWLQTISGQKGMFDERRRNDWWLAVSDVYASYRDNLHERGYYDYSDTIIEVITQLEQNPDLLASVQERFLYVLIDEFQDTNAAQLRLAHLVSSHHDDYSSPNLMAVGDDDQSIFAFNGAELNNMLSFRRTYSNTKVIVLQENYRSTQAVLDAAATIIEQANDRLVMRDSKLTKNLHAANSPAAGQIDHMSYLTREHQLLAIAERISEEQKNNSKASVAVLARHHASLRQLSSILNRNGVPISYEQQNNVLEHEIVKQIGLLAEISHALNGGNRSAADYNLSLLLQHPAWHIKPKVLWRLALDNYPRANWLSSLIDSQDSQLSTLGNWLLWLSRQAAIEPLPVMLEYFIGLRAGQLMTSPLREHFLSKRGIDNSYLEGLSAVQTLRNATEEFTAATSGSTTVEDFLRMIRLHRELDRPITDQSWFVSGNEAVHLMTVHKAKGLEFDTVFLLDAIEDNWRPRHIGRKPPANLPLQPYGEQYDDYVRLLYVAATRAKRSLIISSYRLDNDSRELLPTPLISQIPLDVIDDAATSEQVLETTLTWPRLESKDEKALLKKRLDNYQLSATALLQFVDVSTGGPLNFLDRQLLRLPDVTTTEMAYGTAIHKALQAAQQLTNDSLFKLSDVIEMYTTTLDQQNLPSIEHERYSKHGAQVLTALFNDLKLELKTGGQAEISVDQLQVGNAILSGKLDRVDTVDDLLIITDYKTAKPLTSFTTRDQTKAIKAWRHRTQLTFYALLARESGRFKDVNSITTQMQYVEAESTSELTLEFQPTKDDIDRLKQLIAAAWRHINNLNFPDTSHYSADIKGIAKFEQDLLDNTI